jgi:hypothetical protein
MSFSHNGKYCACFDSEHAVALFSGVEGNGWNYVGKYRVHSKPISGKQWISNFFASEKNLHSINIRSLDFQPFHQRQFPTEVTIV